MDDNWFEEEDFDEVQGALEGLTYRCGRSVKHTALDSCSFTANLPLGESHRQLRRGETA